ncbi:hypothetical protein Q8F55_004342 [Vanrija albida]|uniref:MARVEL domain-containing protein n=1 Tax=Vanrija albida TaxID=181172 RepID=A0ABR3Q6F9_9TREE
MGFAATIMGPSTGLLLIFAYVNLCLGAVVISWQQEQYNNYPPASVALMVCGAIQMIWLTLYCVWRKTSLYSAANMLYSNIFFGLWAFGSVVALTVERTRHKPRYCPPGPAKAGDCAGAMRGQISMGWCLFGWTLFHTLFLFLHVKAARNPWSTPLGKIPLPESDPSLKNDTEAAPASPGHYEKTRATSRN